MIEELTEKEVEALDANRCPDCGGTKFLEGPHGGMSVNVACANCGSKFNVTPGIPGSFGKERIGRPVGHMNWYYKVAGGHTHVRVFMNGGKCGDLCFRNEEFTEVREHCPWIRFMEDK